MSAFSAIPRNNYFKQAKEKSFKVFAHQFLLWKASIYQKNQIMCLFDQLKVWKQNWAIGDSALKFHLRAETKHLLLVWKKENWTRRSKKQWDPVNCE